MCGIIGYLGNRQAASIVIEGLKRLEYRGYDSAGVCVLSPNGNLELIREVGKIVKLEERLKQRPPLGTVAIGHSRWATHGPPSEANAHPHMDCKRNVVLVHNGIIENYMDIRKTLASKGHRFVSQTDTEVIAHLFEEELARVRGSKASQKTILAVTRRVQARLRGAYAVVALVKQWPDYLIGLRKDCPLVIGVGSGEVFLASDIPALLPFTKNVVFLNDGETAILSRTGSPYLFSVNGARVQRSAVQVSWNPLMAEKDGHKHFMHKEIHEGPRSFEDTLRTRTYENNLEGFFEEAGLTRKMVEEAECVRLVACGTAYYAGMVAEYLFERLAGVTAFAEIASEFRYKSRILKPKTLMVAISQSGETADTLAAVRQAKLSSLKSKIQTVSIVNQIGSTLTRETQGCIYTRCGPEIGVASTKAFVAQLAVIYLLALAFGRVRGVLSSQEFGDLTSELLELPAKMRHVLNQTEPAIEELAKEFKESRSFLYLGRDVMYPVALEGALKLKEISYIHAEGYAAGEMKHGPIALIDPEMPVFAFAPKTSHVYEKMRSNLEEANARGAKIITVLSRGDRSLKDFSFRSIEVPVSRHEWFEPIASSLVTQLFAYHVANLKGLDVDQPRNLAKSVTVE